MNSAKRVWPMGNKYTPQMYDNSTLFNKSGHNLWKNDLSVKGELEIMINVYLRWYGWIPSISRAKHCKCIVVTEK